jgi:pimeloyl-ACP methyl ester carboxylesterase
VVLACAVLGGCITRYAADPDRLAVPAEALAPIEWPTLPGHEPAVPEVDELGLSRVLLLGHALDGKTLTRYALGTKAEVVASRRDANGLLLALNIVPTEEWSTPAQKRKPSRIKRLQYIVNGPTLREAYSMRRDADPLKIEIGKQTEPQWEEWGDLLADSVAVDLREPSPFAGEGRGVIIWYHSLGGLLFEEACIAELQKRGWLIAVASFPWGVDPDLKLILVGEGGETGEEVAPAARLAARSIDRRLATAAYAAEAVRAYVYERSPMLREKALLVWGASAGSFCVPAVAARLGGSVDAAILVGSGANLLAVSQGSTFFDGGVRISYPLEKRAESSMAEAERRKRLRQALLREYASATVLDPLATAAWLRGVPVLMLHGGTDEIVPAKLGDELWERLWRPERWTFSAGHEAMFWRLSSQAQAIADWVDGVLPRNLEKASP